MLLVLRLLEIHDLSYGNYETIMILSQLGHDRHHDEKLPFGDKQRQAGGPANGLSPPIVAFWFSHLATVLARPAKPGTDRQMNLNNN